MPIRGLCILSVFILPRFHPIQRPGVKSKHLIDYDLLSITFKIFPLALKTCFEWRLKDHYSPTVQGHRDDFVPLLKVGTILCILL
jgi:hypothetical protein